MLPPQVITFPIWGTSILNLSHVHMWVPHLICHFDDIHWPFASFLVVD